MDYFASLLKSRIVPLGLVFVVLLGTVVSRIFTLQIINGDTYQTTFNESIKKTMSVQATRGRIYDKNGVLLAYNDLAYAVTISDSGTYKDNKTKNAVVNSVIEKTLNIIESKGDAFYNDFQISYGGTDSEGNPVYKYEISGTSLLRFQRDTYGTKTIAELTEAQKNSSANEMVTYLCQRYELDSGKYSPQHLLEILYLRTKMSANSYNRYISFIVAYEVSDETVAAILENSSELIGVTVEEQYIRRYVDGLYSSQILGYTGTISSAELESLKAEDSSYESNDVVGKTGIEKSLEAELSGTKGSKTVYVDTVGRITEVLEETEPVAGNDVYLTIDIELQRKIYNAIEAELVEIILSHLNKSGVKYEYTNGQITSVYITPNEMYFALIDNNIISLDELSECKNPNETSIYEAFLQKKESVMDWLDSELYSASSPYNSLDDEHRAYIWYIYKELLVSEGIFNMDNVDASDAEYKSWIEGSSSSFEEFLKYAISKNWIDMKDITDSQYTSLSEAYNELVEYMFDVLDTDENFFKKMYKYLIENRNISPREVCLVLFEQGAVNDDEKYSSLSSGKMSAIDFMWLSLEQGLITPAQLALQPCSGAAVATDPQSGEVIALVSYPSYDNNKMSGAVDAEYYSQLLNDQSLPLHNWATQTQMAPGSTFKMCTAIAGMDLVLINSSTHVNCNGTFDKVNPHPHCAVLTGHGSLNLKTALRESCNIYFYEIGYKLAFLKNGSFNSSYGTSVLQKYAEELGLATRSGIEISEATPFASNTEVIASSIGQGNHAYSALNLSRYVNTIANSGTCYNFTLIRKITDQEGNVISENEPSISNVMDIDSYVWNDIHEGMRMMAASNSEFDYLSYKVAAKTGTAQERTTESEHAVLVSYAPYEDPKVALAVVIPHGYYAAPTADLTAEILNFCLGIE